MKVHVFCITVLLLIFAGYTQGQAQDTDKVITVIVDRGCSASDAIVMGHYCPAPLHFDTCTLPSGPGIDTLHVVLVHLDVVTMNMDYALAAVKQRGLVPVDLQTLLFIGAQYPQIQVRYPIVALGTVLVIDGDRYSPMLSGGYGLIDDDGNSLGTHDCPYPLRTLDLAWEKCIVGFGYFAALHK